MFVSLHTHTVHSTLDGVSQIPGLVQRSTELGMPAIGISDHGSLSGAYDLWKECTAAGVKPIIGMEAYVAPESRWTKSPVRWGTKEQKKDDLSFGAYSHMTLIARSTTGLRNLYKLHELSYTEGFYYHPRVDLELLERYSEGLIATTGCAGGAIPTLLRLGLYDRALDWGEELKVVFGGSLYVEVMFHDTEFDAVLNPKLINLAFALKLPLVATNDSHFTRAEDAAVHQAMLCVGTRSTLDDPKFTFSGHGYHLRSFEEMSELGLPAEAISNTVKIANEVESYDEMFQSRELMPKFDPGWGHELRDQVIRRCTHDQVERAVYELKTIEAMGYEDYFLVVADIVNWAKGRGILVGPGRGSAGGSLVAYLLGITELDPIRHGLLFERFLNPERLSMPDIDLDFQDDRRQEVLDYVTQKYGADSVAQIATLGTVKARSAVKDAARVLGREYKHSESLVALIPPDIRGRTTALSKLEKLKDADPEVYDLALGMEGLVRSTGKHAAGIIISPIPLSDAVPVKKDKSDTMLTCTFEQGTLEALGFVKLDILSLKELSVIALTLEHINEGLGS